MALKKVTAEVYADIDHPFWRKDGCDEAWYYDPIKAELGLDPFIPIWDVLIKADASASEVVLVLPGQEVTVSGSTILYYS